MLIILRIVRWVEGWNAVWVKDNLLEGTVYIIKNHKKDQVSRMDEAKFFE